MATVNHWHYDFALTFVVNPGGRIIQPFGPYWWQGDVVSATAHSSPVVGYRGITVEEVGTRVEGASSQQWLDVTIRNSGSSGWSTYSVELGVIS